MRGNRTCHRHATIYPDTSWCPGCQRRVLFRERAIGLSAALAIILGLLAVLFSGPGCEDDVIPPDASSGPCGVIGASCCPDASCYPVAPVTCNEDFICEACGPEGCP